MPPFGSNGHAGALIPADCAKLHGFTVAALLVLPCGNPPYRSCLSNPVLSRRSRAARPIPAAFSHHEKGFTLVELLVVLSILGLLVGLVGPAMIRQLGSAKHRIAGQSVERLAGILDLYRLDVGTYPTTQQGLAALNVGPAGVAGWNGPYTKTQMGSTIRGGNPLPIAPPANARDIRSTSYPWARMAEPVATARTPTSSIVDGESKTSRCSVTR